MGLPTNGGGRVLTMYKNLLITLLSVEMRVKQHSLGPNTGYL